MIRPAPTSRKLVIDRQIPKREVNLTASTDPLLQSIQRVLMGSGRRYIAHVSALWVIVAGDNLLEQPLIVFDARDDQLCCLR